jgi:hypothetical protein
MKKKTVKLPTLGKEKVQKKDWAQQKLKKLRTCIRKRP